MKRNFIQVVLGLAMVVALLFAGWIAYHYSEAFGGLWPKASNRAELGAMGDFFGGVLNPFFSFLGLVMLLVTLLQNQNELELTRTELRESGRALKAQASTLEKQRFEDTFFSLFDQLNRILERVTTGIVRFNDKGTKIQEDSLVRHLKEKITGGRLVSRFEECANLREAQHLISYDSSELILFFRILYRMLELIALRCPDTTFNAGGTHNGASQAEKFYSNLVRSFLPDEMYFLLAINCYAVDAADPNYSFKILVERYSFLESMLLFIPEYQNTAMIDQIVQHFAPEAFGNSVEYAEFSKEVKYQARS